MSSNALTWLKRLKLSGRDLTKLYIRVREKLLSYGTEVSGAVPDLLRELGSLSLGALREYITEPLEKAACLKALYSAPGIKSPTDVLRITCGKPVGTQR